MRRLFLLTFVISVLFFASPAPSQVALDGSPNPITAAQKAAIRSNLGVEAWSAILDYISAVTPATGLLYWNGTGFSYASDYTLTGQSLINVGKIEPKITPLGTPGSGATVSLSGQVDTVTIASACTLSFPSDTSGVRLAKEVWITNGNAATITWSPMPTWASGSAPSLSASGLNILYCESVDGWTTPICWQTK
jgi:hypothetical protein